MIGLFYLLHIICNRKQVKLSTKKRQFDVLQSQIDTQEQTFQEISAEIHDNISLTLSLSKIYLHDLDFSQQADVQDKVNLSVSLIRKAMNDLNNLSKSLNADSLQKFGLLKSVEELVNDISRTELFRIKLNVKGVPHSQAMYNELIVFRMIQETLNNIIRHANATEVIFWMDFEKTNLKIRICDNGVGFNQKDVDRFKGSGLANLAKRAQIMNAALLIESFPTQGTTVKIIVPVNQNS
jgi:two-component system, NarL family, sensor kinase